ncbi:SDR family NAD(P)-dependent oxidoreductase [Zhongshania aquimaris]|uniref:SDR family oxidoreductase n=1 Tax=Zhongshania aquimaris TaxID=2857107 RepID=A0ABS6VW04_9GAMM|nr:SDR family NAD(P)-dependent oxidoreductase [Zhongshania aquimaris]MBW2942194.1 SDR family oxidoreductase [Zhongshania aquimaris]
MPPHLTRPVAVVTGAASGIGRASAELLADGGARVCVADINIENAKSVAEGIRQKGGEAVAMGIDVSLESDNKALARRVSAELGPPQIIHLNAGILRQTSILDCSLDEWEKVLRVNLSSVFLGLKYMIPTMPSSGGSVIVTASFAGREGNSGMPSYVASKHGVVGLVKAAAAEFGPRSIRVNAVCPGPIYTDMMQSSGSLEQVNSSELAQTTMLRRVGEAHEVAQLVCFLASEASSFITGAAYPIDGGMPLIGKTW